MISRDTTDLEQLAMFRGKAAFDTPLHVGRPNIGKRERFLTRVNDILDRKWLSNNGPYVQEFEARVAEMLGVKHCVAVCNGTAALEIAIRASGLTGEVLVPSFTFIATAHALQWQQITPVFCDIDPQTHMIDPEKVERMITPRTSGMIGVHLWGRACQTEALADIAQRHGLRLLFDASHAFLCSHGTQMIGNFGHAEVFSFHATKFLNTFEGGAIVTNDDELAAKMRLMKNFGFSDYDKVTHIGTNGKMSEISAAMGLTGLESVEDFINANRRNYDQYRRMLSNHPGLRIVEYPPGEAYNYQYVVLELDQEVARISRDQLIEALWTENVLARRYFYPGCHRMEPYKSLFPHAGLLLPQTEALVQRIFVLPTGTSVSQSDVKKICQLVCLFLSHPEAVQEQLDRLRRQKTLPPS